MKNNNTCPQCDLKNGIHKLDCEYNYYEENDKYIYREKIKKKPKKFKKDKDEFN